MLQQFTLTRDYILAETPLLMGTGKSWPSSAGKWAFNLLPVLYSDPMPVLNASPQFFLPETSTSVSVRYKPKRLRMMWDQMSRCLTLWEPIKTAWKVQLWFHLFFYYKQDQPLSWFNPTPTQVLWRVTITSKSSWDPPIQDKWNTIITTYLFLLWLGYYIEPK